MPTSLTSKAMPRLPTLPSLFRIAPVSMAARGRPKKSSSNPPCVERAIAIKLPEMRVHKCAWVCV